MAKEKRLINAYDLKKSMFSYYGCVNEHTSKSTYNGETLMDYEVADLIEDCIDNAPTGDAVPVVHGRWERCGGDLHSSGYAIFCSVCNKVHFVHRKYSLGGLTCKELFVKPKYCPSCGAVMEGEE